MKNALTSAWDAYRRYRVAKAKNKLYRTARYLFLGFAAVYMFLLCYPQVLFAHQVTYKNFTVYSHAGHGEASVEELFNRDFDRSALEVKVLNTLQ